MNTFKKIVSLLLVSFFAQTGFAVDHPGRTLTLTIINHSKNQTLTFVNAKPQYPNISFDVTPREIVPNGGTATVTAKVNCDESSLKLCNDLSGVIYFSDSNGNTNSFSVIDRIQAHVGQPIFGMNNARFSSTLKERTVNKSRMPNELSVVAATVEVSDK